MLHGMWDLPGPGLEPMSPASAGGFLTTAPPGKSLLPILEDTGEQFLNYMKLLIGISLACMAGGYMISVPEAKIPWKKSNFKRSLCNYCSQMALPRLTTPPIRLLGVQLAPFQH